MAVLLLAGYFLSLCEGAFHRRVWPVVSIAWCWACAWSLSLMGCVDAIEKRVVGPPEGQWSGVLNRVIVAKLDLSESDFTAMDGLLPKDILHAFASKLPKSRSTKHAAKGGKSSADAAAPKAKANPSLSAAEKVDVLAVEQLSEYAARIGKWRRHLLFTINDRLFLWLVRVMNLTRAPLIHLSHFLKQRVEEGEPGAGKLRQLVCHKAESIKGEFDELFRRTVALSNSFGCLPCSIKQT